MPSAPSAISAVKLPRQLALQLDEHSAPLLPLEVVMAARRISAEAAESLVDQGALGWVFNIARPSADRRELRVHRDSLLGEQLDLGAAIDRILPLGGNAVRGKFLARQFSCSPSHIINLLADRELIAAPGELEHCKASPIIMRSSVRDFLVRRTDSLSIVTQRAGRSGHASRS